MRILVVTHNYPRFPGDPAGAFVARIAEGAAARGHEVRVVAPHSPGAPEAARESGVHVVRFRYAPEALERVAYTGAGHHGPSGPAALVLPLFWLGYRRAVRRVARSLRPEVIHAHWWIPSGWLVASLGYPFVLTCHGSDVRLLERHPAVGRAARRVLKRAFAVTAVSRFLADDLGTMTGGVAPVTVIPMPLDLNRFARGLTVPKAAPPRILYAGNLVPGKGVDLLIEAFARLRARSVACRLRLLGEGPERPSLEALARRLGVEAEVEWGGLIPQDRMPDEYGASEITVLASRGRAEGLGLTLAEALLAGCAVVGTAVGGIPELVRDQETGLLARDGDAAHLAQQLERLLLDPALGRRLGAAGRALVQGRHDPELVLARFLELYLAAAHRSATR